MRLASLLGCIILAQAVDKTCMVLLAGGVGSRMNASIPKQFMKLGDKEVIDFSINRFYTTSSILNLSIVVDNQYRADLQERLWVSNQERKASGLPHLTVKFADPGRERFFSVVNGVAALDEDCSVIGIHDSARPLLSARDLKSVLFTASRTGSALLSKPIFATIKKGASAHPKPGQDAWAAGVGVLGGVDRSDKYEALTPQVFNAQLLKRAIGEAKQIAEEDDLFLGTLTDDEELVRVITGKAGTLVMAEDPNFKITTPDDLVLAQSILRI